MGGRGWGFLVRRASEYHLLMEVKEADALICALSTGRGFPVQGHRPERVRHRGGNGEDLGRGDGADAVLGEAAGEGGRAGASGRGGRVRADSPGADDISNVVRYARKTCSNVKESKYYDNG